MVDDEYFGFIGELIEFYQNYYRDDIAKLAQHYPREDRSLTVEWSDLYSFAPDFAHDLRDYPHGGDSSKRDFLNELHEALYEFDLPSGDSLEHDDYADAHVRVKLPQHQRIGIGDLRDTHKGKYVAIHGQIERVTQKDTRLKTVHWDCTKCGNSTIVPQPKDALQEPGSCSGACQGKPNWEKNLEKSKTVDERKLKLKQPPEESDGNGEKLVVYLEDDLAFAGGDRSLMGMAGERVTVHGILKRDESKTRGRSAKPILGSYVDAHALEFESSVAEDIDTEKHRETIEKAIEAPDTLDRLIAGIAPGIKGGKRMYQVKRGVCFFLFGAERKVNNGSAIRGDIHMAMIGDPSTGKTQLLDFIEEVSPRVERLSGTQSTGVGLTASAEQDEFAGGNWVLKPGLLPRASGGHAIVDEIDKMGDAVDTLHEALETQRIRVGKAGINAKLKTEAGVIVAANPVEGRFGDFADFVDQIDIDPALFSRFDIIHTLHDKQDRDIDGSVAGATLNRWQSGAEESESGESDVISPETIRAWIAIAQELEPVLTDDAKNHLEQWYVEERDTDRDTDKVPVNARSVPTVARIAEAHARIHLREEITIEDAQVATEAKNAVLGDIYMDGDTPNVDVTTAVASKSSDEDEAQKERVDAIVDSCGGMTLPISDIAEQVKYDYETVRSTLESMKGREAQPVGSNRYKIKEVMG